MPRKPSCRPPHANSAARRGSSRSSQSPVSAWMPGLPAGEQHPAAQVERLQALGRPLVADRAGDVGVLGGRPDHRADPRRGQRDLAAVLDRRDRLDRDDVLQRRSTPLRVSKWSSSASYWSTSVACSIFGAKTPVSPGTTTASRSPPVSRVASGLTRTNRPTSGVEPAHAGDRGGHRRPRRRLLPRRHRVLEVEHDGVGAGLATALSDPGRLVARDEQERIGTACISSSAAGRGRARRRS